VKRRDTGILGEKLAGDFLKEQGYQILETNYHCPEGEIDIIARHEDSLVFVEVKTRTNREFGTPEESITSVKKKRIRTAALRYQEVHTPHVQSWRIDVVAVELDRSGKPLRIELIENAVGDDY